MGRWVLVVSAALAACSVPRSGVGPEGVDLPVYVGERDGTEILLCVRVAGGEATCSDRTIGYDDDAVLGVAIGRAGAWYSDLGRVTIGARSVETRPLDGIEDLSRIWWYRVESVERSYRNSARNPGWWADIEYEEYVDHVGRKTTRDVDVRPVRLDGVAWKGRWVGTGRWKVAVELGSYVLATPGKEAAGQGGVLPGVRRVSRLGGTGNAIVDSAMSLSGLPYIWGSAVVAGVHQAERYIGADCADLVVAAWRLAGIGSAYSAVVPMIGRHSGSPGAVRIEGVRKGAYVDSRGNGIPVGPHGVEPGAAVLWRLGPAGGKGHAAILVEDRGLHGEPNGLLDGSDLVLHAMWDEPRLEPVSEVLDPAPVLVLGPVEG
jgi:cell wall-associated NlpC family hydrolase